MLVATNIYHKLITLVKRLLQNRLVRFFMVGGINSLFGYSVFSFLVWTDLPYPTGVVIVGTIIGICFNFNSYGRIVFQNKNYKLIWKFCLVYFVLAIFNQFFLSVFEHFKFDRYLSGALLAVPSGLLGFVLNRTFVFSSKIK
jgi:putative flippase GtrA